MKLQNPTEETRHADIIDGIHPDASEMAPTLNLRRPLPVFRSTVSLPVRTPMVIWSAA